MRTLPEILHAPRLATQLTVEEWTDLLPRLKSAGLLGHFGELLRDEGIHDDLPPAVRRQLDAAASNAWVRARSSRWECGELVRVMAGSDIPVLVVKGASYLLTGALPGRGRYFGDVDIIVAPEALPEVERRLLAGGWTSGLPDPGTVGYYRQWLHQIPPFVHQVRGSMVDVHHTIIAPWGGHRVDVPALFRSAVPTAMDGLLAPSPLDRCLVVSAHFVRSDAHAGAFRDLLDLSELLREAVPDEITFAALVARAHEVGLFRALSVATHFASVFFGNRTIGPRPAALRMRAHALVPDGAATPTGMTRLLRRGQQISGFRAALPLRVMAQRTIQRRLGMMKELAGGEA